MKHAADTPGLQVDDVTRAELRRLANLFLLAGVTLVLFVLRAVIEVLPVTSLPSAVFVIWGLILLTGWAATLVYGVFVTLTARSWGWLLLCLIPVTSVPAGLAYAWIRRGEIERALLGDERRPSRSRRRSRGSGDG